jgi:hypothetical protein
MRMPGEFCMVYAVAAYEINFICNRGGIRHRVCFCFPRLRAVITLLLSSQRPICIFIIGCTLFLLHLNDGGRGELLSVAAAAVAKIAVGARLVVIANLFGLKRLRGDRK